MFSFTGDERATVEEALRRGAAERLLVDWLVWKRKYRRPPEKVSDGEVRPRVQVAVASYRAMVSAEYKSLPSTPRGAFGSLDHYFEMRPLYYINGFDDPAETIFRKIEPIVFLGGKVGNGLHAQYARFLRRVENRLSGHPKRYAQICGSMKARGGFMPRFVANTTSLSNHAFGMAIDLDIDPGWRADPHVVNDPHFKQALIPLMNEIVMHQARFPYDFGSNWVRDLAAKNLNLHDILIEHPVFRNHDRWNYWAAKEASDAIREFLKENLTTYQGCLAEIAKGDAKHASAADKENARQAKFAIDSERDLQLLKMLNAQVPMAKLEVWRKFGVMNMPVELVAAFYREAGGDQLYQWGGDYINSKDFMHFEIRAFTKTQGALSAGALTPDVNHIRPLNDLFPPVFLAVYSPTFTDTFPTLKFVTAPPPPLRTAR